MPSVPEVYGEHARGVAVFERGDVGGWHPCVVVNDHLWCIDDELVMSQHEQCHVDVFAGNEPSPGPQPGVEATELPDDVAANNHVVALPKAFEDGHWCGAAKCVGVCAECRTAPAIAALGPGGVPSPGGCMMESVGGRVATGIGRTKEHGGIILVECGGGVGQPSGGRQAVVITKGNIGGVDELQGQIASLRESARGGRVIANWQVCGDSRWCIGLINDEDVD